MSKNIKLSDQQYQIVRALWELGEGSAKDVQHHIKELNLAHTTVGTILTRLEKKGVLVSEPRGRQRIFKAIVSEEDIQQNMVSSLVSTLFKGNASSLLAHLVRENEFSDDDLEEIRSLLDNNKNQGE
ncbi:BlaI/MecI/CopY family transcriptional regulator [Kordiimonas sp. SCSIO 12610]|uniref:BlaI/MecI/CopY family transcriptional regulator n=1 Tax=Kordiimonas sp. SCSIO 12610 TaxID=2829597 RepID=UPI00210ECBEA|nr:BlaI/MecI/CopY family transcriptional regulator [Kordiimonas sp. SCSIO 12610]UTW56387.1 BlaI/MecI/CopY family transcriptional regulator [Kordiimonas sp. SCSIO 12610]